MHYLFYISFLLLITVWFLYPIFLKLIVSIKPDKYFSKLTVQQRHFNPDVSIIIAAHNEANNLKNRCENIFSQDYKGEIEVIIASDGSTDSTTDVITVLKNKYSNIQFIDIQPQSGRSNAHNLAVNKAKHNILIFTDAETIFDDDFITHLVTPFQNHDIGFVSGKLKYFNPNTHSVSQSVSLYWRLEMFLRKAESLLGLYALGTGACCAVRKNLYRPISATGDIDFITPLDVVLQEKKCIHADQAIAWDELPDSPRKEFNARIRMTSKNIKGTIQRWGFASIFKKPKYSLVLFFHKLGRWLTPFFLISLFLSNLSLLTDSYFYTFTLLAQLSFYLLGLLGALKIDTLYSQQIYGFLLANTGFLLGVLKAIFGNTPHLYRPVAQQK